MMQWRSWGNDSGSGRESDTARAIVEEPVHACAFCRGKGEKPAGSRCSVCRGKGTVEIRPPAVKCALCKGRGEERPRGNVTCNACRGKGYITVTAPVQKCASCRGTGRQRSSLLACLVCRGAGVVSISQRKTETAAPSTGGPAPRPAFSFRIGEQPPSTGSRRATVPRATARKMQASPTAVADTSAVLASELEILRLYARASLAGERIILTDAARRTPAYVNLLKGSLIEKGLLRQNGPRKFEITERCLKVIRKRGGVETMEDNSKRLAAPKSAETEEREWPPHDAPKVGTSAAKPSISDGNALRWTTLRGI